MENKDWREEYNKLRVNDEYYCGGNYENKEMLVAEIKSFIESLLKSKQEEIEGEMEKTRKEITHPQFALYEKGYNQALDDLKPIISNILK